MQVLFKLEDSVLKRRRNVSACVSTPHQVFSKELMIEDFIRRVANPAQARVPHSADRCPFSEGNGVLRLFWSASKHH
jgi:hypothetical protein